jgi:hypothetical protein
LGITLGVLALIVALVSRRSAPTTQVKPAQGVLGIIAMLVTVASVLLVVPFSTDLPYDVGRVSCRAPVAEVLRGRVPNGTYLSPSGERQARAAGDEVAEMGLYNQPEGEWPQALDPKSTNSRVATDRFDHVTIYDYTPCTRSARRKVRIIALSLAAGILLGLLVRRRIPRVRPQ